MFDYQLKVCTRNLIENAISHPEARRTTLVVFDRSPCFGCTQDNSLLGCVDDAGLDSLAKYLAGNSRELRNDFHSPSVAGNCD